MKSTAKQFGAFLFVGLVSGAILAAANYVFRYWLLLPPAVSYACGFLPVVFTNFVMMRKVVMPSDDPRWGRQLLAFIGSTFLWRGLEYGAGLFLMKWHVNYWLMVFGNAGFFTVLKFVYYKLTVFAPKRTAAASEAS